jgi:hypothetical protein
MKEEPAESRFSFEIHNKVPPGGLDTFKIELNRRIIAADAPNLLKSFDGISKCSKVLVNWMQTVAEELKLQVEKKWRQIQILLNGKTLPSGPSVFQREKSIFPSSLEGFSVGLGMRMIRMLEICCRPEADWALGDALAKCQYPQIRLADNPSECYEYQNGQIKIDKTNIFFVLLVMFLHCGNVGSATTELDPHVPARCSFSD